MLYPFLRWHVCDKKRNSRRFFVVDYNMKVAIEQGTSLVHTRACTTFLMIRQEKCTCRIHFLPEKSATTVCLVVIVACLKFFWCTESQSRRMEKVIVVFAS